jgi:hypothetical protein
VAARLTFFLMKVGVAVPLLGVAFKVAKAKYGVPGEGFFDGGGG